jgi:hypothetical protein
MDGKLGDCCWQLSALSSLIYLQDSVSNQQFLVDTGAAVSVFPHMSDAATSGPLLTGADGKPISSLSKATKKTQFWSPHLFGTDRKNRVTWKTPSSTAFVSSKSQ